MSPFLINKPDNNIGNWIKVPVSIVNYLLLQNLF